MALDCSAICFFGLAEFNRISIQVPHGITTNNYGMFNNVWKFGSVPSLGCAAIFVAGQRMERGEILTSELSNNESLQTGTGNGTKNCSSVQNIATIISTPLSSAFSL